MFISVAQNSCITPESKDKEVYYLTFDLPKDMDAQQTYAPGDWLTVRAKNHGDMVASVLNLLGLTGHESIEIRRAGKVTVSEALEFHLELTQINPAILNKLQRQFGFDEWQDRHAMIKYVYGKDIVDLLESFPQLQKMGVDFLALLSPLAPRYYSIASAPDENNTVSLLYRKVAYQANGRERFGVASSMLAEVKAGQELEVEFKSNPTFKLPQTLSTPIIMIGSGAGLAPYIGFMEQRSKQALESVDKGVNVLFFGETYQKTNCLFCNQLEQWQKQGVLQTYYAFSRDQTEKFYVQDRIKQNKEMVWRLINEGAHLYICGSQTTMAESVKQTMLEIFAEFGDFDAETADSYWQQLRKQKRLQMDVY